MSGSLLNDAMHEDSNTSTYQMVYARVKGLLAIINNQVTNLNLSCVWLRQEYCKKGELVQEFQN